MKSKTIYAVICIFFLSTLSTLFAKGEVNYHIYDDKINTTEVKQKFAGKGVKVHPVKKPFKDNKIPPPYISNAWFNQTGVTTLISKLKWDQLEKDLFLLKVVELSTASIKKRYPQFKKEQVKKLRDLMANYCKCAQGSAR
jgi:hypothetical protein